MVVGIGNLAENTHQILLDFWDDSAERNMTIANKKDEFTQGAMTYKYKKQQMHTNKQVKVK